MLQPIDEEFACIFVFAFAFVFSFSFIFVFAFVCVFCTNIGLQPTVFGATAFNRCADKVFCIHALSNEDSNFFLPPRRIFPIHHSISGFVLVFVFVIEIEFCLRAQFV